MIGTSLLIGNLFIGRRKIIVTELYSIIGRHLFVSLSTAQTLYLMTPHFLMLLKLNFSEKKKKMCLSQSIKSPLSGYYFLLCSQFIIINDHVIMFILRIEKIRGKHNNSLYKLFVRINNLQFRVSDSNRFFAPFPQIHHWHRHQRDEHIWQSAICSQLFIIIENLKNIVPEEMMAKAYY